MTDYADLVSQADRARADIAHFHQIHLWDGVDVAAPLAEAEKRLLNVEMQLTAATIEVIRDIAALSEKLDSARRYLAELRQYGFSAIRWYHAPRFHG